MKSFLNGWGAVALLILSFVYLWYGQDNIDDKIRHLRKDVRELKGASVSLKPGSNDYQVIRHELGSVTLSLKEVKAHDNGSAITLEIGNLTSAHITGASMKIEYQTPLNSFIESSLKYDVDQTLEAGKATKVTLILERVNPSAVTYIRVSDFQPKGIRLIQAD